MHPSTANGKPGTTPVTFLAAGGVVFNGPVELGAEGSETAPSYVSFDGNGSTTIRGQFGVNYASGAPATHDSLFNTHLTNSANQQGALVFVRDASYFSARGNEIGPGCCSGDGIGIEIRNSGNPVPDHISLLGNRIHDLYDSCSEWPGSLGACSGPGYGDPGGCSAGNCDHIDGIQAFGGQTLDIERNRVYLQGDHKQGIFLQSANGGSFSNITLANNMVSATSDNGVSFGGPGSGVFSGYANILYNTFQGSFYIYNSVFAAGSPVTIAGNILQGYAGNQSAGGCSMSYADGSTLTPTWSHNLLGKNQPCGAGDTTGTASFVAPSWPLDLDLTATATNAINKGESTYCGAGKDITSDANNTSRPLNTTCDIGADEAG